MVGFEIYREGGNPIYRTSQAHHIVREISYEKRSFRLVNDAVLNDTCSVPHKNFSLNQSSMNFVSITDATNQSLSLDLLRSKLTANQMGGVNHSLG